MSAVVIAGTNSGAGKTTVSMAIMAALAKHHKVQPFKVGPDYIDPAFHSYITKRSCRNLDSWMVQEKYLKYLYLKNNNDADISIIEGVMGLFDGAEIGSDIGSTAKIAKILSLPVILVVNAQGISQSVAAIVKGYADFDKDLNLKAVIFNNVSGEKHYQLLKEAVEKYSNVKALGYLTKSQEVMLPERHLGLVPAIEQGQLNNIINKLAYLAEQTIDLNGIKALAKKAKPIKAEFINIEKITDLNLALAYDKAFNFYYQDNLDLLQELGVNIIKFSPLTDKCLPIEANMVMFGGGFPEVFAAELESNKAMLTDIKNKLSLGLPYVAECGGLMYLCNSITTLQDKKHSMVAWFNSDAVMTKRLQRFGYATLTNLSSNIYGDENHTTKVHEFHRSKLLPNTETKVFSLQKIRKQQVIKEWTCGLSKLNGVGSYAHLHYYANLSFPQNLVKSVNNYLKKGRKND
ncbi:cobyrinate a,c-diamide synthase [Clostridium sp. 'deep sea']|uniref:cobyrinate a,c-diamide synthase n=1 Tax=Clostridium sp. 'deep sea' TaxID=2779445 RepID=UPI0018966DA1|nr:cobyrinate a,c-diamide synthase [Clostridium sp. 'deep sea']QOR36737.1 cobyrinate a,c-diamide synthase [Clostridium sp. 'deep sea']